MLEVVVGIMLLAIGVLGYAAVTARLARAFFSNAQRERSADLISGQREIMLREGCARSASGTDNRFNLALRWTVGGEQAGARSLIIATTRPGSLAAVHDSLRTTIPCI